jgi:hypothetical protein
VSRGEWPLTGDFARESARIGALRAHTEPMNTTSKRLLIAGTLAGALQFHFDKLSDVAGKHRAGSVHRLDRDTSGV